MADTPRSRPATRDAYRLFRRITTRWMDNDVYGHVNNVVYYAFFDTAVNAALIEAGLLDPATSDIIGLVVETGCRYAAPLGFPGDIDAGHPRRKARHVERALRGRPVRGGRGDGGRRGLLRARLRRQDDAPTRGGAAALTRVPRQP